MGENFISTLVYHNFIVRLQFLIFSFSQKNQQALNESKSKSLTSKMSQEIDPISNEIRIRKALMDIRQKRKEKVVKAETIEERMKE